ncbi:RNA polymerase sigma factor [Zavarzinella formosa]|uniref:RNA polymerase sigma factor n=1 Tax=Zavarzinella formosa TaxID=360055 RepID=UPI0002FD3E62|nr:sigma-70 family RNA polymerase sigma factor [Zavarzinella formosa]
MSPAAFILIRMNATPPTDEELVSRVCRDQSAFEELHRRYDARLRGFLKTLNHSPSAIPDLSQETWLKVYTHLGKGNPFEGNFRGWLFRIGENTGKDMLRKRKALPLADDADPAERDQKWRPDAEDTAQLQHCFGDLSDREREVVRWRLEGQSSQDVANTLQITPEQVYATFNRAKTKLQTCLGATKDQSCSP